jgi:hypothetical protein
MPSADQDDAQENPRFRGTMAEKIFFLGVDVTGSSCRLLRCHEQGTVEGAQDQSSVDAALLYVFFGNIKGLIGLRLAKKRCADSCIRL